MKVLRNKPAVTGRAAHRQRLLNALGWKVVPIKEEEWLKLNKTEKQHFLQQVLAY